MDSFEVVKKSAPSVHVLRSRQHVGGVPEIGFERPSVGVEVSVTATGGCVQAVKLAVMWGSGGPSRGEDCLSGKALMRLREMRPRCNGGDAADAVTDLHGSADYKAYLVGVLLRQTFEEAYQTATATP